MGMREITIKLNHAKSYGLPEEWTVKLDANSKRFRFLGPEGKICNNIENAMIYSVKNGFMSHSKLKQYQKIIQQDNKNQQQKIKPKPKLKRKNDDILEQPQQQQKKRGRGRPPKNLQQIDTKQNLQQQPQQQTSS